MQAQHGANSGVRGASIQVDDRATPDRYGANVHMMGNSLSLTGLLKLRCSGPTMFKAINVQSSMLEGFGEELWAWHRKNELDPGLTSGSIHQLSTHVRLLSGIIACHMMSGAQPPRPIASRVARRPATNRLLHYESQFEDHIIYYLYRE